MADLGISASATMADLGVSARATSVPPSSRGSANSVAGTGSDVGSGCGPHVGRKGKSLAPAGEDTAEATLESASTEAQLTRPDQLTRDNAVFVWVPRDDLAR